MDSEHHMFVRERTETFIGRAEELEQLVKLAREATASGPQVVLVSGEAGAGKTRLIREFAARVKREQQLPVWFGRCYEDFAHPYLPFIEELLPRALRLTSDAVQGADVEAVRGLVEGREAADVPAANVAASLRLAAPRLLRELAATQPFVWVIEDLHWADGATLGLLSHIVYSLADVSEEAPGFLLVCTFREPVDGSAFAATRPRLAREPVCRSIDLVGLDEPEARDLIEDLCGAHSSQQLVSDLVEVTGGNPLFIRETLAQLAAVGALSQVGETLVATTSPADVRLPREITQGIAERLAALDGTTQRTLSAAAVMDGSFRADLLTAVLGAPAGTLAATLQRCVDLGFLVGGPATFTFSHPLVRTVCYGAMALDERRRLHRRIATELGRTTGGGRLLERAHHLIAGGSQGNTEEVSSTVRAAADRAAELGAWTTAAAFYDEAAAHSTSKDLLARAELHDLAAQAFAKDQDPDLAREHWEQALTILEAFPRPLDDTTLTRFAAALGGVTRSEVSHGGQAAGPHSSARIDRFVEECGDRAPEARALVLSAKADLLFRAGRGEESASVALDALAAAEAAGDGALIARAQQALGIAKLQTLDDEESLLVGEQAMQAAEAAGDEDRYVRAASRTILPLLGFGRVGALIERADEVSRRSADGVGGVARAFAEVAYCAVAAFRGDWGAVERHAATALTLSDRANYYDTPFDVMLSLVYARLQQGEYDEARDAVDLWTGSPGSSRGWAFHQLIDAAAGNLPRVIECAAQHPERTHWQGRAARASLPTFAALIELANVIGDPTMIEHPRAVLRATRRRGRIFASPWPVLVDRLCGIAAVGLGDPAAAEHHFDRSVAYATEQGARPELGLSLLDRARLLGIEGDADERKRAVQDLTEAVRIFGQLGMQPALAQCQSLAGGLEMSVAPAPAPTGLAARHGLTERQLEVLRKLASGLTNEQIAAQLMITLATAKRHIANVYSRLGVNNRVQATNYCYEHGLMD